MENSELIYYKHKEGVCFRKLRYSDLNSLIKTKLSSWQYTHGFDIITENSQKKWFEELESSDNNLVLVGMLQSEIGGRPCYDSCGIATFYNIDRHNRSLQIGGHVYPKFRKTGASIKGWYAGIDFAFEMLNMNRIYGEVLETNISALKLDEATMRKEGIKKQAVYQSGRYLDSHMFGLLRDEWIESDRVKSYNGTCNLNLKID